MAGLIARLFGGGRTSDTEPAEPARGIGGYTAGPGPANQSGFPGSTTQTRTFPGRNPTNLTPRSGDWTTIKSTTNYGFTQQMGTAPEVRQSSYRGDTQNPVAPTQSPRKTSAVVLPQTLMRQQMQRNSNAEFFGGPMLKTGPGNDTAGGQPLSAAAAAGGHSAIQTTTPLSHAQFTISGNVPGSQDVRNTYAQRYKNKPGQVHDYLSAPRADQAQVNPGGQATDGNVHPSAVVQPIAAQNRFNHEGVTSWAVLREMPYGGRGNGARGADLNGQRYYATGQETQFWNAGQGDYGVARLEGGDVKRPVAFTQPAPWTANFYDTTADVGTLDNPNTSPAQQPQAVYTAPGGLRASNSTGRLS